MRNIKFIFLFGALAAGIFYLIASGCTWVNFTAEERLNQPVDIKSSKPIKSIYLEFTKPQGDIDKESFENFKNFIKGELEKHGFTAASTSQEADLVLKLQSGFFKKQVGTLYFFLGIIPMQGFEGGLGRVQGVDMKAIYVTGEGKWKKNYRSYKQDYQLRGIYPYLTSRIIWDLKKVSKMKDIPKKESTPMPRPIGRSFNSSDKGGIPKTQRIPREEKEGLEPKPEYPQNSESPDFWK